MKLYVCVGVNTAKPVIFFIFGMSIRFICSLTRYVGPCQCLPGYDGQNCEREINECRSHPCQNGGTCIDLVGHYICSCPPGTRGRSNPACFTSASVSAPVRTLTLHPLPRRPVRDKRGRLCHAYMVPWHPEVPEQRHLCRPGGWIPL